MKFKTPRVELEWHDPRVNGLLRLIVEQAAARARERWDWDFTLTCIHRTPEENDTLYGGHGTHLNGVHTAWRGVDVRTRDADPSAVLDLTTWANDSWTYDPDRAGMRVALPEGGGIGSSAPHLHFQASAMTERKEELPPAEEIA